MHSIKILLLFFALAVACLVLGIILNDIHQVYFGTILLILAVIVFIKRKFKHHKP